MSISRYRNFHKNTINFTKSNKCLKTNLILKNKILSHLERGTHWVIHLAPLFILLKCCTPTQLYCLQNWEHSSDWKVFKNQKPKNGHYFWRGVYKPRIPNMVRYSRYYVMPNYVSCIIINSQTWWNNAVVWTSSWYAYMYACVNIHTRIRVGKNFDVSWITLILHEICHFDTKKKP